MSTESYTYNDFLFAQLYDQIIEQLGRSNSKAGLEFIPQCAALFGDSVLEMGCGTGLNLLPLAEMGCSIVGLDNSAAMLKILEQKLSQVKPEVAQRVELVEGDMVNPPIHQKKFRLIIFAQGQFLHLQTDAQRLACLKSTHNLLTDDGVVLICNPSFTEVETWDEWREQPGQDNEEWLLLTRCGWKGNTFEEEFKLVSKSQRQQEHLFHWCLHPIQDSEMQQLIQQAGLRSMPIPSDLPTTFHPKFKRCAFRK